MPDIKQGLLQILETTDWSAEDRQWLLEYLDKNDTDVLRELMQQVFSANTGKGKPLNDESARHLLELIHTKIKPVTGKQIGMNSWKRVAAAAAIIIVIAGAFFFYNQTSKKNGQLAGNKPTVTDIIPGGNKAVLTLADGSVVVLDNAQNGTLSQQGNTKVLKLDDGQLAYNTSGNTTEVLYNTISTPRGGQYRMTLSDGSKVWLNAASSIKFPVAFVGSERKVEMTGEAYFEVANNTAMPFKVNVAGKQEVEVLGTHFNINAYSDEATINTTLLEGKVKVSMPGVSNVTLKPGQQTVVTNDIKLNTNIDMEEIMAWKNGKFVFQGLDIQSVMRQVSKWYNVDVEYKGPITKEEFVGIISRNVNVSEIIRMLEQTGAVKLEVEGSKIIVK